MLSFDEIISMSQEDFTKNWESGKIQDSTLKLIGARKMTEEEKKQAKTFEF